MSNLTKNIQPWFLHIDLDAFYASVEQLDNPSYRGKPVIVGGRKEDKRGVVSTASYEARKYGVHSAMPLFQAIRLCPNGIFVRGRMDRYLELSSKIMKIFEDYSPDVDQMSIDEAFIDITGTENLFGPPEKTAMAIKKRVKDETGLTVSVGLAPTKYLAKIASGYSKPDGFYFIHKGEELSFMQNLPLNKVWGIGPKALERLKRAGLFSTRDIYEKSYDILEFMFGTTMASFLYNVVRGEEKEVFTRKAKSHSISSSNTFPIDITDTYTAETELLELAQSVMFRLMNEEKFSRTVSVKIKYDDFTTVSIQKTFERNILTLDSFFEKIKMLFEEKYQVGRGIRLLGVGFDKVETEEKPYQQSLFDDMKTEEKKQKVEKAILELKKKHPDIKIQKARLLKAIAFVFIISSLSFTPLNKTMKLYASENESVENTSVENTPTTDKDSEDTEDEEKSGLIFNYDINDKTKVDFSIYGKWQADLKGSFSKIFNSDLPSFFDAKIPVFKQDIDLTALVRLNKKWFFEAGFADNFSNNTISLGYDGDKYLKKMLLSNRNITMPSIYSSKYFGYGLSGGVNQSPGFMMHLEDYKNQKWSSDFLFRYDMTQSKSATYYGMNKVTDFSTDIKNYTHSKSFIFPSSSSSYLENIKDVYVENPYGSYTDENGKTYKKLSMSDYLFKISENILYINYSENIENKKPTILLTFYDSSNVKNIVNDIGSYDSASSFLGNIQSLFSYNLNDFAYPLTVNIENTPSLVIQEDEGFSPFLISNSYSVKDSKNTDLSVISKNTKKECDNYTANIKNNNFLAPENNDDKKNETSYILVQNKDYRYYQFPFADKYPEIYLNIPLSSKNQDIEILQRSYNSVSKINIGQKASGGSIRVFKNNRFVTDYIYNPNTGDISFTTPLSSTDIVKIEWEEEASNFEKGAFSSALGFNWNILPFLSWDIAFTSRFPLILKDTYYTPDNIKNSFAALTTSINFDKYNLKLSDKASFSVDKPNASDTLLISTQKDYTSSIYKLNENDGVKTTALPFINNQKLNKDYNYTVNNYVAVKDDKLAALKIPLEWDFSPMKDNSYPSWASIDVKAEGGKDFKNSSSISFALAFDSTLNETDYKVYLQLGIKANSPVSSFNPNSPVFDITSKLDFTKTSWNKVTIELTDKDRAFLVNNNDFRIIVVSNKARKDMKGKLFIGSYKPSKKSIFTTHDENITVHSSSIPSINSTKNNKTFSSEISWSLLDEQMVENSVIKAYSYFSPSDFSLYKSINFVFAFDVIEKSNLTSPSNAPVMTVTLTDGEENEQRAIELSIFNLFNYITPSKKYHTLKINTQNNEVFIDDIKMKDSDYKLYKDKTVVPSKIKYEINTMTPSFVINKGSFIIENVTYESSSYNYLINNIAEASYSINDILKIKDYPIFENAFINASSSQKFSSDNTSVISSLNTGITVTGIALENDIHLNQDNITNIAHSIKTATPILKTLSISENYRMNKDEVTLQKNNNFNLSLSAVNIPIIINSDLSSIINPLKKEQNHATSLKSDFNIKNVGINFSSLFSNNQKMKLKSFDFGNKNYFENYKDITTFEFSTGDKNADYRKSGLYNTISFNINKNAFTPYFEYNLECEYENISKKTFKDTEKLSLSLPVNFNNNTISLKLSKKGGDISESLSTSSYFEDMKNLFDLQKDRKVFYSSIPFYELFDTSLSSKIKGNYKTDYELMYNRKISNDFKDLYIPSKVTLGVEKDITTNKKDADVFKIKTTIFNNSINNFGRFSEKQIFDFFDQEELSSSISATVKIPSDKIENTTYEISSFMQLLLIINPSSILNSFINLSFETDNQWQVKGSAVYTRKGKTCLMSSMACFFFPKAKDVNFDINRKDYFNFSLGQVKNSFNQKYEYSHDVDMTFFEYFTITSSLGASFTNSTNIKTKIYNSNLALNYSIGGKISF